ncbi:hypothetical protein [Azospirillum griseum]|uniref:Uncharacterized protein n=3 Tax=Azospirillum griseum TaxID=2496639 RepID=A0A431VBF1_9PROT|nr:hypothetical protein [Azospirillum griseum]RTR15688.1 hypothetical protein EJ903_22665 [Azospirillum griseum]
MLPDLLAAERKLARFDERLLADPERRHRWRHDHARRAALAAAALGGRIADPDAFLLMLADPSRCDPDAAWVHTAWTLATALQGPVYRLDPSIRGRESPRLDPRIGRERRRRLLAGLGQTEEGTNTAPPVVPRPPSDSQGLPNAAAALMAQTRALLANAEDLLSPQDETGDPEVEDPRAPDAPLSAWTVDWCDELQQRWAEGLGGRAQPLTQPQREAVEATLQEVEAALLDAPGLLGVARAMRVLLTAPEAARPRRRVAPTDDKSAVARALVERDRGEPGLWTLLAWLGSGTLVERACGLQAGIAPSVAPVLARDRTGFRLALERDGQGWERWLLSATGELIVMEMERSAALDRVHSGWEEQLGLAGRRGTSRLPAVLHWLHQQPAYTTAVMERTLGRAAQLSRRGVYLLAAELREAGVVREAPTGGPRGGSWEVEKLWIASALTPQRR